MILRSLASGLVLLGATPALAQQTIRPGQQVVGQWQDGDTLVDHVQTDCLAFDGVAGQAVQAQLRAPYLNDGIILHSGGDCSRYGEVARTESALLAPAVLRAVLPASGRYSFSVRGTNNTYQFGFLNAAPPAPARAQIRLSGGDMITGRLETGDRTSTEGALFDCFVLDRSANRTVKVDLTSQGFGPRASIHRGSTCEGDLLNVALQPEAGTISVSYRMPDDGAYSVRIGSGPTGGVYRVLAVVQ